MSNCISFAAFRFFLQIEALVARILKGIASAKSVFRAFFGAIARRLPSIVATGGMLIIAACSPSNGGSSSPTTEAVVEAPTPEYSQKDGDAYMYVSNRSEEDIKQNIPATVVTYRYLGMEGDVQKLELLSDEGVRLSVVECSNPCRVAKQTPVYGPVTRLSVEPRSILAAAFRDAFNGLLVPATLPANANTDTASDATAPKNKLVSSNPVLPAVEDYRGKKGRCRLTVNGSTYINGSCWVRLESDGSFQVMSLNSAYFAQLSRSSEGADGYWNETSGSTHAHSNLGPMKRKGACWVNDTAEICAWDAV